MKYTLMKFWRCFFEQSFHFFIHLINDFSLRFYECWSIYTMFATACVNTIIEPLSYIKFSVFPWNTIGFLIFRTLNKWLSRFIIFNVPYVPNHYMSVIFVYKTRACLQNGIVLRKSVTSRLERNLLKLNVLDLIGFVSKYTTVGSSNFISIGKDAFPDRSWKIWGTVMRLLSKRGFWRVMWFLSQYIQIRTRTLPNYMNTSEWRICYINRYICDLLLSSN